MEKGDKIYKNMLLSKRYDILEMSDLILPDITYNKLNMIIRNNKINNMIIVGDTGSGKSSVAILLARKLIEEKDLKSNLLYLNACDDRGLTMISNIVEPFCNKKIDDGKFKLVIIDDAQSITVKAQTIISTLMDNEKTKFILTVSDMRELSDAIQSRCSIIYFPKLMSDDILKKLERIVDGEKIRIKRDVLETIIKISDRDLRQSINMLEGLLGECKKRDIDSDDIYDIFDQPNPKMVYDILENINNLEKSLNNVRGLLERGFSSNDILLSILNYCIDNKNLIEESRRLKIYEITSVYHIRVNQGTESRLQLYGCIVDLFRELN